MIAITVNNEPLSIEENTSLENLVLLKLQPTLQNGIAVALNEKVIQKIDWNKTILKNQDKILIIKATQGG